MMDMLNVASTGIFTILALIVNLKWYACKKWTSSLKLVVILAQYSYTKTAQRIFKYSDIQYISLTMDKILNSLVYRTLFYVNIYESYKLLKTVRFFGPPCIFQRIVWVLLTRVPVIIYPLLWKYIDISRSSSASRKDYTDLLLWSCIRSV